MMIQVMDGSMHSVHSEDAAFGTKTPPSAPSSAASVTSVREEVARIQRSINGVQAADGAGTSRQADIRNLMVNYIPNSVTEDDLYELFSVHGPVVDVRIIRDRATQAPRGFGFVTFEKVESASAACEMMNGLHLRGKRLKVTPAVGSHSHNIAEFLAAKESGRATTSSFVPRFQPGAARAAAAAAATSPVEPMAVAPPRAPTGPTVVSVQPVLPTPVAPPAPGQWLPPGYAAPMTFGAGPYGMPAGYPQMVLLPVATAPPPPPYAAHW